MQAENTFSKQFKPVRAKGIPLARISHQHSCRAGQPVLPDVEETSEGKVHEPCRGWLLKADGETDVQGCRMVGEKCGLGPVRK